MNLEVYLYFKGNCREAMEFYQKVFGGKLDTVTYESTGDKDPAKKHWLMHAYLSGGEISLMASDTEGASAQAAKVELCLTGTDEAKAHKIFEALSEGAESARPLRKEAWGDMYGKITDKFGVDWAFNIGNAK